MSRVKVVRVLVMLGDEEEINDVLDNSWVSPGNPMSMNKFVITEVTRAQEKVPELNDPEPEPGLP